MKEIEEMEYEAPALLPVGEFNEVTTWYGWASNDGEGVAII
ncbi:lasso RiPP family leader peptide-containing protein [Kitasatospora sp. NPDC057541]